MNTKLTLIVILAGLSLIFILQNTEILEIRFLFWTLAISQALFMFLLMAIGLVIGWLLNSYTRYRRQPASHK